MKIYNLPQVQIQNKPQISFQSGSRLIKPLAADVFEKASKAGVASGATITLASVISGLLNFKEKENISDLDALLQMRDLNNIEEFRNKLIPYMEKNGYDEFILDEFKYRSDSPEDMHSCLDLCINRELFNYDYLNEEDFENLENGKIDNELDNKILKNENEINARAIPMAKLSAKKDVNPEIIKLKEKLKKDYGIKEMFFNNDKAAAFTFKKVLDLLKANNIEYNGTIIVIDNLDACGINLYSNNDNYVIVNPNECDNYKNKLNHVILHEILHSFQPRSMVFSTQKIPEDLIDVANNVSPYARGNFALEIHCELHCKKLEKGLSEEEERLFSHLGGDFCHKIN